MAAQQQKLNELFYGLGFPGLTVDGDSGRLTEQQLCAARVALGMPISRADMEPGGPEEQALMAATSVGVPPSAPTWAGRWILIDKTCQVIFVGEGTDRLVFVFQTSTGSPGYETRDQNGSAVFRYNPARGNNGWHNSYDYPVGGDNPLNGNMYKPLYFDNGQAIHGANNVPTNPRQQGMCPVEGARPGCGHQLARAAGRRPVDLGRKPDRADRQRSRRLLIFRTVRCDRVL